MLKKEISNSLFQPWTFVRGRRRASDLSSLSLSLSLTLGSAAGRAYGRWTTLYNPATLGLRSAQEYHCRFRHTSTCKGCGGARMLNVKFDQKACTTTEERASLWIVPRPRVRRYLFEVF